MSDMGRFVAASIRDKTVADLLEENDRLRTENDRLHAMKKAIQEIALGAIARAKIEENRPVPVPVRPPTFD
jgi:regulator of replication initiation timing